MVAAILLVLPVPAAGQQAPGRSKFGGPMSGTTVNVGSKAPEINATAWINTASAVSLAASQGNVVLVEFFATWCRPCVINIPHLTKIAETYGAKGLRLVSLTQEPRDVVDRFLARHPITYPIGVGSTSGTEYGASRIPYAVLIGKDGTVIWSGHPASSELEQHIITSLGIK